MASNSAAEIIDAVLAKKERSDYRIFCACDTSETLVGYVCFGPIPMTDTSYDLYWIAVDHQHSREGVGRMLLSFAERAIAHEGGQTIYVETSSTEPYRAARFFYRKNDYEIAATLRDFYAQGNDKIIYTKKVSGIDGPTERI